MTAFTLKLIACAAMAIDHIGYKMPFRSGIYLRIIGRISMPIFAFFIAEGFRKTRNIFKYALRLLLFAVVSEIPFDMYFYRVPSYFGSQNVFLMLFFGLIAIWAYDSLLNKCRTRTLPLLSVILICILSSVLNADYGWEGVLTCFIFYLFPVSTFRNKLNIFFSMIIVFFISCVFMPTSFAELQAFRLASLPLLFTYNGNQTNIKNLKLKYTLKLFFYLFYPVHLVILSYLF